MKLRKRLLVSAAAAAIATALVLADISAVYPAAKNRVTVIIENGTFSSRFRAELISSTTFVSVREFSLEMGAASVTQNGNTITVSANNQIMQITAGKEYIVANGRYIYNRMGCRVVGGEISAPIRVLSEAFSAGVEWQSKERTVRVYPAEGFPSSASYPREELYWLSRIVSAEARGESFEGKIAVANVVCNRAASDLFPDGIKDVIFDKRFGVQFSPAYSGSIYNTPSEDCVAAAAIALGGTSVVGDSLFFSNKKNSWASRNRAFAREIGGHYFYY
ncbi:MAG: cell wall hydrolase [Oscillospiraceae bacterium]|nr:cell wall hydrolase [Oscillospiraceae bacterium]